MSSVLIDFDAATGIGRLTLNRPEVLNAVDGASARALLQAVRQLTQTPGLRVIVLAGAGRAFAAGGDVASFLKGGAEKAPDVLNEILDAVNPAVVALRNHPAPVITAVRGAAAGAGLALAILGDVVVAEERARFVLAYDKLGTSPDCGASWFLPRRVGRGVAFQMMLTGRILTAPEALAAGLVDQVEPEANFDAAVDALAARIAAGPTQAFGQFKRLMDSGLGLADQLEAERAGFLSCIPTQDFSEGVHAFLEKRTPAFKGR